MARDVMQLKKLLAGLGLAMLVIVVSGWPTPAWAATDQVDSWQINFTVDTTGVLHVRETMVYRFGSPDSYGIDRTLLTRQPWGTTDQDAVFLINNITVTSPDASSAFTIASQGSGRNQQLRIRIGSPDKPITTPTAKYTLTYDVAGALRPSDAYDELYWNALGAETPLANDISISVTVPGGVRGVLCYSGPIDTSQPCTTVNVEEGVATITQSSKSAGDIVAISADIASGLVSNNEPHLVALDQTTSVLTHIGAWLAIIATATTAVIVTVLTLQRRRDERFLDVPPGTIEPDAPIGWDDHPTIPVVFVPPNIPVASAGLLDDAVVDSHEMTAVLLLLATRGAIQLRQSTKRLRAKLVSRDVPLAPHEAKVLADIFRRKQIGDEKVLTRLRKPYTNMKAGVLDEATRADWFVRQPSDYVMTRHDLMTTTITGTILALIGLGLVGVLLAALVPRDVAIAIATLAGALLAVLVGRILLWLLTQRGQRSAVGRAYADQVAGFRQYLATADADQVRFDEGQDIFSQYLPWAAMFGLTDHWVAVCEQLVAKGRLSAIQPSWYYGDIHSFDAHAFAQSLGSIQQATAPTASTLGGGPAFGNGGGLSGGGGAGSR